MKIPLSHSSEMNGPLVAVATNLRPFWRNVYPSMRGTDCQSEERWRDVSMFHLLIYFKVKDHQTWKRLFDGNAEARKKAGVRGGHVFPTLDDPNEIFILYEWDSPEHARAFFQSPELKKLMATSGVIGQPENRFLTAGERIQP
jgi:quinol monooxygenase YgiN